MDLQQRVGFIRTWQTPASGRAQDHCTRWCYWTSTANPVLCCSASTLHSPNVDPEGCHAEEVPLLRSEAGQAALRLRVARQCEQLFDHEHLWVGEVGVWVGESDGKADAGRQDRRSRSRVASCFGVLRVGAGNQSLARTEPSNSHR